MTCQHTRFLIGAAFVLAIIGGGFLYSSRQAPQPHARAERATLSVSLSIQGVLPPRVIEARENDTALTLLRSQALTEGFSLAEKEYAGLGTLVEQIGDFKNGTDGKYWTYTVNGILAGVGAGAYQLENGDNIEWAFTLRPESY